MAFTFVVETGVADPDANSYCDTSFADDYISTNAFQSATWLALDDDQKQKLLVRSSKYLDIRFLWHGERVDEDSGLRWPRAGVHDVDGFIICDDTIPTLLQDATAEMASYLMNDDWTSPREEDQYREVRVDSIDVKYDPKYRRAAVPDTIVQMLLDLGIVNSGKRPMFKPIVRT